MGWRNHVRRPSSRSSIPADCVGPLDDFLQVRATFDIEGGEPLPDIADAGTAGDLPAIVDLPQ